MRGPGGTDPMNARYLLVPAAGRTGPSSETLRQLLEALSELSPAGPSSGSLELIPT